MSRLATAAALALAALLALPGAALAVDQKLLAGDGAENDRLGDAIAVDGDTAVVGAFNDDGGKGAVYVFTRSGDSWSQIAKLTASDGAASDNLGDSVAIDGDTIIAGASFDDVGANANQGSVYTFARTGAAARTETAKLTASDGAPSDNLGSSVAIDGDTIVAGAFFDDVGANADQGSVYTFARTGAAARTETARLTASDGAPSDFLGRSVAIDGDTIVAGAPFDDVANANEGSAYTFARTGAAARTQTAKLAAADNSGFENDLLGGSVAIDGDTIVAGVAGDDLGANENQGSVLTFTRTGGPARSQTARLRGSDGGGEDKLGTSVAIDGDTIVAGAPFGDVGANPNQGAVYTFASTGGPSRTHTGKLTASGGAANDQLGDAVAVDGDTIVAGAPFDNSGAGPGQGSASVFFPAAPSDPELPQASPGADLIAPRLAGARLSRTRFRAGRGTVLSYRLSEAARVTLRIERKLKGRRVRSRGRIRCVKRTRRNARRRCTLYRRVAILTRASKAGLNRIAFSGRVGGRKLRPGSYRLTLTPTDAAGNRGTPRRLSFRVVR
jgi:hypothetical protein